MAEQAQQSENHDDLLREHDPHYEPIVSLPEVTIPTLEEDETEMIKMRAKLFRYDKHENPPEWKERGTGDIKLLKHNVKNSVRVVMRRDKTLKLCANHFVTPWMELKPNHGSDRAWVYSVEGDFADGEMKPELLAVKFANAENAKKWKDKFEEAKILVETECDLYKNGSNLQDSVNEEDSGSDSDLSDDEQAVDKSEENKVNESEDKINDKLESLKINENPSDKENK